MPETTLQPAAAVGLDTYIHLVAPTTNYETSTTILTGSREVSPDDTWHILIKFDLSAIAPGSIIQEATLTLELTSQVTTGTIPQAIHRILPANSGWTEAAATWNKIDGSTDWAGSAGCSTPGTDYEAQAMGTFDVVDIAVQTTYDVSLEPTIFQGLIDIGNHGLFIRQTSGNPGTTRSKRFASSDHATAGIRPKLYVRWIEPSGRIVEYTIDMFDPLARVLDSQGRDVPAEEIEVDKWIRFLGLDPPKGREYDDLIMDLSVDYIVGNKYDDQAESVDIETDRNEFGDKLLQKMVGGG
jgi:hypothetical protein